MKRCSVRPYEGADNYIFVSYCHRDKQEVYPIIERLARDGYRVWYDEGIDPGADWPEVIADHLSRCALCIAFLSDNALNSHNCRREINFTLLKRKPLISVAIETVAMSPGMQMQLSSAQSIAKVGMSDDEFFGKLYRSPLLASSKGAPDESVHISSAAEYQDESYDSGGAGGPSFSDMWFSEQENSAGYESRKVNVTYHPTYHPDPQTIRAVPQQRGEHTKIFSKEDFNREASLKPIRMKSDIRRDPAHDRSDGIGTGVEYYRGDTQSLRRFDQISDPVDQQARAAKRFARWGKGISRGFGHPVLRRMDPYIMLSTNSH